MAGRALNKPLVQKLGPSNPGIQLKTCGDPQCWETFAVYAAKAVWKLQTRDDNTEYRTKLTYVLKVTEIFAKHLGIYSNVEL